MLMWYQCNTVVKVALRKESVDRNTQSVKGFGSLPVALRKESVDRNHSVCDVPLHIVGSLSARRAWIEIRCWAPPTPGPNRRSPQGERG